MKKAKAAILMLRPINCVMMGFAVFVGAVLANPSFRLETWIDILWGFLTGFMLTGAAMIVNDYYDRSIDAINEPARPIPSGVISPREALVWATLTSIAGFAFASLTNLLCIGVAAISWILVVTYLTVGKRSGLPGNFLVSACVAAPFIYGSVAVTGQVQPSVWLFAAMAFLSNTGREITKGIVDVKGDQTEGVKTLAVRYGEKTAAVAASCFYLSAVALTPITLILGLVSLWFVPVVLVTDIGLVVCSVILLKDHSRESARKIKKAVLFLFLVGLLAYLVGVLT
jgi:geranylgeranylglycerol-phosphate geranylgeranyltransferase